MIKYILRRFINNKIEQLQHDIFSLNIEIEYTKSNSDITKDKYLKIHNELVTKLDAYKLILKDLI